MTGNRSDAAPRSNGMKANGKGAANGAAAERLTASEVAGYLRCNPDFLADNPDLLEDISPPGRDYGTGVIDFQQAMVERLRHDVTAMTVARDDLIVTSRHNMAAQCRVHEAVVQLISATSFEHLIEIVTTDLAVVLDLDVVTLGVERSGDDLPPVRFHGIVQLESHTVDALIGPNRDIMLRGDVVGDPEVFGAGAGLVASDALIRLAISRRTPSAMLALGSRQPTQFESGQATELLGFLGRVLESSIRGWLHLTP